MTHRAHQRNIPESAPISRGVSQAEGGRSRQRLRLTSREFAQRWETSPGREAALGAAKKVQVKQVDKGLACVQVTS